MNTSQQHFQSGKKPRSGSARMLFFVREILPFVASMCLPWFVEEALSTGEDMGLVWLGSAGVSLVVVAVAVLGERRRRGRFNRSTPFVLALVVAVGHMTLGVDWGHWFLLNAAVWILWSDRHRERPPQRSTGRPLGLEGK